MRAIRIVMIPIQVCIQSQFCTFPGSPRTKRRRRVYVAVPSTSIKAMMPNKRNGSLKALGNCCVFSATKYQTRIIKKSTTEMASQSQRAFDVGARQMRRNELCALCCTDNRFVARDMTVLLPTQHVAAEYPRLIRRTTRD